MAQPLGPLLLGMGSTVQARPSGQRRGSATLPPCSRNQARLPVAPVKVSAVPSVGSLGVPMEESFSFLT